MDLISGAIVNFKVWISQSFPMQCVTTIDIRKNISTGCPKKKYSCLIRNNF